MTPAQHSPRPKFDSLFADPRHYRADCRLMVTAIRRGWLKDAPQADRDALVARFTEAMNARQAADPENANARALFAEVAAMIALHNDNTDPLVRLLRYSWAGEVTAQATGRPRGRWHVSDYPNRMDAATIQRQAVQDGYNPLYLRSVLVTHDGEDGDVSDTVVVQALPDRFRRVRLVLVCPRCRERRLHLYPTKAGVRCRECAGIRYGA